MDPRTFATQIITPVIRRQKSLASTLPQFLTKAKKQDHALIKELSFGTLRWFYYLDFIANRLITKPLKAADQDIYAAILIGLYQLIKLRTPDHAAINNTVNTAKQLRKNWASGLINAVLRNFQRQQQALLEQADHNESAHYAHPTWLMNELKSAWSADWQNILDANNHQAPLFLRVNQQKISCKTYQEILEKNAISAQTIPGYDAALFIPSPINATDLPHFKEGYVSIQDLHAQLAADWLDLEPNARVLDACAAPGGKTSHILEKQPNLKELLALDHDQARLQQVADTLTRLNLKANLRCADARNTMEWWDGQPFDRILLDAPCSGTGVIRRHPDIKLLRRKSDIDNYAATQKELLSSLWPLLAPGGTLLYATCSVLPEENSDVIKYFLTTTPDAHHQPIIFNEAIHTPYGCQLLTTATGGDGFFYAKIRKVCE